MAGYRRFIAYFYEYIDGKRGRNAGFVKAERRGGCWKLRLQLKGRELGNKEWKIYVCRREKNRYERTVLTNAYAQRGCMICELQFREEWTDRCGKPFDVQTGLWITNHSKCCFLSHWADGEPELKQLEKAEAAECEAAEKAEAEAIQASGVPEQKKENTEREEAAEQGEENTEQAEAARNGEAEELSDFDWKILCSRHPIVHPLEEWSCDCIGICPGDVLWLRQQGWPVGRNSFLMQGFLTYRHLLLVRMTEREYWLGVPGTEDGQTETMARSFGYEVFQKTGQEGFGYWCRKVGRRN